jgi:hypothetical protein
MYGAKTLVMSALCALAAGLAPGGAHGLSCPKLTFDKKVELAKNVVVAEVVSHERPPGPDNQAGHYEMRILKVLKDGELFKPDQKRFRFPDRNAWDKFVFKPKQIVMFFFANAVAVKCNHPIILKK